MPRNISEWEKGGLFITYKQQIPYLCPINHKKATYMATDKDTENSTPSAPAPADNDIAKLTGVTEQDLAEAIVDEYGAKYSKDGKRLLKGPCQSCQYIYTSRYTILKNLGTEIIGDSAFSQCSGLTAIVIPPSVKAIGKKAFLGCHNLIYINIPQGVTTIESSAFSGCSNLEEIRIPQSVTVIGDSAFSGCSNQIYINIPQGVTTIESRAFSRCSNLEEICIPQSVTVIGDSAFDWCKSLKSITIPPSVVTIGK